MEENLFFWKYFFVEYFIAGMILHASIKPINTGATKLTTLEFFYKFKFLLMRRCHGDLLFDPCIQDIFPAPEKKELLRNKKFSLNIFWTRS